MTYDINNKVALVTGANRGIGRAIVTALIEAGATKVYAAVRNLKSASDLVETYGEKVVPIQVDLSNPSSIQAAAKEATDVHIVVNNAGVLKLASPLDDSAVKSLEYELNVNVYGLLHMAQEFAPVLKANGGGTFVQLNSVASVKSFASVATYSASKAAAYSLTQALREVLQEQGTAVVSVHPGPIATDMADTAGMLSVSEPTSIVSESIVKAIQEGTFHVFPDTLAKQIGSAYESFSANVVDPQTVEA